MLKGVGKELLFHTAGGIKHRKTTQQHKNKTQMRKSVQAENPHFNPIFHALLRQSKSESQTKTMMKRKLTFPKHTPTCAYTQTIHNNQGNIRYGGPYKNNANSHSSACPLSRTETHTHDTLFMPPPKAKVD